MSQGFTSQLPVPLPTAQGGTGLTSTTAYAVLCGGTTSTGNLQSIAGVGTSGQVLTSNGASALPTFQSISSGYNNTVQTVDTTNRSTTSTSYVTSSIAVTITPSSNTSKVRVSVFGMAGGSTTMFAYLTLYRDAVDLTPSGVNAMSQQRVGSSAEINTFAFDYIDSPATSSAVTYTIYFRASTGTVYIGRRGDDTGIDTPTFITATEIKV